MPQTSKAISGPPIAAPVIPGLVNGGDFLVVHSPAVSFLGTDATLLNTAAISDEVVAIVAAAPTGSCIGDAPADGPAKVTAPLPRAIVLDEGDSIATKPTDLLLHEPGADLVCDGLAAPSPHGGPGTNVHLTAPGACGQLESESPVLVHGPPAVPARCSGVTAGASPPKRRAREA